MRLQKRVSVVVCLLSPLPHSKYGICSFSGDLQGRLDLELVRKLFYFSTWPRVFAFVIWLPPSTADVACPRFVHINEPRRFRNISWFSILSISPRLMRRATTWNLPAVFIFVFREALPPYLWLLDSPCPWHNSLFLLDLS